jgi:cytochrome c2
MRAEARRATVAAAVLVLAASAGVAWNAFDARADRFARARMSVGGDPVRGAQAIAARGCATCHDIPGIRPSGAQVGPSLEGLATRPFLAGQVRNRPDRLIAWIMDPKSIEPGTAMPDLGIGEVEARDIATYLVAQP